MRFAFAVAFAMALFFEGRGKIRVIRAPKVSKIKSNRQAGGLIISSLYVTKLRFAVFGMAIWAVFMIKTVEIVCRYVIACVVFWRCRA